MHLVESAGCTFVEKAFGPHFLVVEGLSIIKHIATFASGAPSLLRPEIAGGDLRSCLSLTTLAGGGRGGSWVIPNGAVAMVGREATVLVRLRVFVLDLAARWRFFELSECSARPAGPGASMYRRECVVRNRPGYVGSHKEVMSARYSDLRKISSMRSKKSSHADFEPVLEISC